MSIRSIKKVIVILVCFALFSLTACKNSEETTETEKKGTEPTTTSEVAASNTEAQEIIDPMGKYENTIDITTSLNVSSSLLDAIKKHFPDESTESNRWLEFYKDTLNINVKYDFVVEGSQTSTKVNLAIASGDVPDFLEVNSIQAKQMADAGLIITVDELYEKYASSGIKRLHDDGKRICWESYRKDGKLIGIPVIGTAVTRANMMYLRKDWLENLNLSEPKTIEDVIDVIKAFALNDPDKNGENDTFGLGVRGYSVLSGGFSTTAFFNAYGAYPNIWLEDADGKLHFGLIQPEVKTALLKLQELYSEGCLDKEFAVKKFSQITADVLTEKIGFFMGPHYSAGTGADIKETNPSVDWLSLPAVGKASVTSPAASAGAFVISKDAKNPEAIIKMMNLNYSVLYGNQEDYERYIHNSAWMFSPIRMEFYSSPEKNLYCQSAVAEALETKDVDAAYEKVKNYVAKSEFTNRYTQCYEYEETKDNQLYSTYLLFGRLGSQRVLTQYKQEDSLMVDKYFGPTTETQTEKWTTLNEMWDKVFVKIVMGEADISEFDSFITNWKKLGGDDITKEVNEWYASNKSN